MTTLADFNKTCVLIGNDVDTGRPLGVTPPASGITINGTIAQGSTVSLSPASGDFGAFGGEVIQYARGDEGANGTHINGTPVTLGERSTLTTFVGNNVQDHLIFSTGDPRPGRTSCLRRVGLVNGVNHQGGFGYGSNRADPKVYISYNRKFTSDDYVVDPSPDPAPNVKHGYLFANGVGAGGQNEKPQPILHCPARTDGVVMGPNLDGSDGNVWNTKGWGNRNDRNTWRRWEQLLELNTVGVADGKMDVWRDGELGITDHTFMWQPANMDTPATGFKDYRLGHMDTNLDAIVDYTDYYIASTPARIELAAEPTWSATTHKELQPVDGTNWLTSGISNVTLDKGAFPTLSGLYLYVVKADGTVFNESGVAL